MNRTVCYADGVNGYVITKEMHQSADQFLGGQGIMVVIIILVRKIYNTCSTSPSTLIKWDCGALHHDKRPATHTHTLSLSLSLSLSHTHTHTHTHAHTHTHTYAYTHTHTHSNTHTQIYTHERMCMHAHAHTYIHRERKRE